jgi:hypothetical protein
MKEEPEIVKKEKNEGRKQCYKKNAKEMLNG